MNTNDIFTTGWQDKETKLIKFEEDWRDKPYLCSEGYPTVGFGFKIGPKGADLSNYDIKLPLSVGEVWLSSELESVASKMVDNQTICAALNSCNDARQAVLLSMAYQMGITGLAKFKKALSAVKDGHWQDAQKELLDSLWAKQTPNRAKRHAEQILTGEWYSGYGVSE